jgi:hypothetical protein
MESKGAKQGPSKQTVSRHVQNADAALCAGLPIPRPSFRAGESVERRPFEVAAIRFVDVKFKLTRNLKSTKLLTFVKTLDEVRHTRALTHNEHCFTLLVCSN